MTEAVKHTPGPWEAGINPKGSFTNEIVVRPAGQFPHGEWIADCGDSIDGFRLANARLIAAAPELLDALKYARRFLNPEDHDVAYVDFVIDKATGHPAAISRAEGRS